MKLPDNPIRFLQELTPPGINGSVIAIDPATEGTEGCVGCGYVGGGPMKEVHKFIDSHSKQNLYWTPNALIRPLNKKCSKSDIASMRWVHLDKDDPSPAALNKIQKYHLRPTLIVASGGGYNAYWALKEPVYVNGNIEDLERANKKVIADLAPKDRGTGNIDRILRLPFTTNWPTESKLKKNPDRVAVDATIIEYEPERTYTLDQFGKTFESLPDSTSKDRTRSGDLMRKVVADKQAGLSKEEILAKHVTTDPHALDQPDPARAVQRCIDKVWNYAETMIAEINEQHAITWVGGKLWVMWLKEFEGGMPRFSKLSDIKIGYKPQQIGKVHPIDYWVGSPSRREYLRIVCDPTMKHRPTDFNVFRGWAVEPDPKGDCSLFLAHMRDVICDGDTDLYDYVIQWFANSVQLPGDRPGTALTMQSDQGAGKGQVGAYISGIYGDLFCQIAGSGLLTGQFNKWIAGKIMVFGDEVTWDRKVTDKLKALITEPRIMVEPKHVDAMSIDNFARFIFTTNREHSAPAEITDRRFVVLKLSNQHIGDDEYWKALVAERENGGPNALLHYLLNVKLTRNLRMTPKTAALAEQKLLSLDDVGRFWRDMLMTNDHILLSEVRTFKFNRVVEPRTLHAFYLDHAKRNQIHSPVSVDSLMRRVLQYLPGLARRRARATDWADLGITGQRPRVYELPRLGKARREFEARLGHAVEWPVSDDDDELLEED